MRVDDRAGRAAGASRAACGGPRPRAGRSARRPRASRRPGCTRRRRARCPVTRTGDGQRPHRHGPVRVTRGQPSGTVPGQRGDRLRMRQRRRSARGWTRFHTSTLGVGRCPAATDVPSGLNATVFTQFTAPVRVPSGGWPCRPLSRHSQSLWSWLAAASRLPARAERHRGHEAPPGRSAACRSTAHGAAGSATSHSRTVLSALPAASVLPSGTERDRLRRTRPARSAAGRAERGAPGRSRSTAGPCSSALPAASVLPSGLNATE